MKICFMICYILNFIIANLIIFLTKFRVFLAFFNFRYLQRPRKTVTIEIHGLSKIEEIPQIPKPYKLYKDCQNLLTIANEIKVCKRGIIGFNS